MRSPLAALCPLCALMIGCAGSSPSKPSPTAPFANAGGPYAGIAQQTVNFSGAGVDPQQETLTYVWTFGDGGTAAGTNPSHIFATPGAYTVTLTVSDTSGLSTTSSTTARIPNGVVYGAQKPLGGAHVYLLAANTAGYGKPSLSLLSGSSTSGSDTVGAYVSTDSQGTFLFEGDYACTPGTQVYAYAAGGAIGAATAANAATGLLAALGNCPAAGNFSSVPSFTINEVSTVATAYAVSGFAVDATHVSSSGTPLAQKGIANAFANVATLETLSTGTANALLAGGNGTAPAERVNLLADILAGCVSSGESASGRSCDHFR